MKEGEERREGERKREREKEREREREREREMWGRDVKGYSVSFNINENLCVKYIKILITLHVAIRLKKHTC